MPDWSWPRTPDRGYRFDQRRVAAVARNPLHDLTLPRVSVMRHWDPEGRSVVDVALEVRSSHSDPVLGIFVTVPWRRPRPGSCELEFPPTAYWDQQWRWRGWE